MGLVIRSSDLVRVDRSAVVSARKATGVEPAFGVVNGQRHVAAPGQVMFPRYVPGVGTRMLPMDARRLPAGWQGIRASVPMRLATCAEANCTFLAGGWTEVMPGDGNRIPEPGLVEREQAAGKWGRRNGQPPAVIHHPPGTPCPRIHKLPNGIPPVYEVNGRPVLWNEFEDSLGGGVHTMQRIRQEGRS